LFAGPAFAADSSPASKPLPPPPVGKATTTSAAAPRESASYASAESGDDHGILVAPLMGFTTNDLNFGIGLRAAKLVTDRISIGGTFVYQFGQSEGGSTNVNVPGYTANQSYSASMHAFYIGPEVGYDFALAPVTLRAYTGLGIESVTTSVSGGGASASSSNSSFVIWPGAMVWYDMPQTKYFLGGDARLVTVPGGPAFSLFALAGMHL
jgi:hypothetical protein